MESIARITGDVDCDCDWEYEGCCAEKEEELACWALVSCSKSDWDESNSNDKAGSLTATVVASCPIFSLFKSLSRASRKSLSCGTLYQ